MFREIKKQPIPTFTQEQFERLSNLNPSAHYEELKNNGISPDSGEVLVNVDGREFYITTALNDFGTEILKPD